MEEVRLERNATFEFGGKKRVCVRRTFVSAKVWRQEEERAAWLGENHSRINDDDDDGNHYHYQN